MAKRRQVNKRENLIIRYFGKKSMDNLESTSRLLPNGKINVYVDSCTGSGSVMVNLLSERLRARKVAIDKDPRIIAMHLGSKEYPGEVIDAVGKIQYSREGYAGCMECFERYAKGYKEKHGDMEKGMVVDAAAAEAAMLYMSRNGMAGIYQPFMKKERMDRMGDAEKRFEVAKESVKMHRKIARIVHNVHYRLRDVELFCGDFMDEAYIGYWEDGGTFSYLDVPYMYSKRNVRNKKKDTGYRCDWEDAEHERFLGTIEKMHGEGRLKGKLMICSNFELDGNGKLKGLQDDVYNRRLLEMGFRLVVTEWTHSCETHVGKDGVREKTPKAEVVWINYKDIKGIWGETIKYYDFQDIY